jgi:hypothetical protein
LLGHGGGGEAATDEEPQNVASPHAREESQAACTGSGSPPRASKLLWGPQCKILRCSSGAPRHRFEIKFAWQTVTPRSAPS